MPVEKPPRINSEKIILENTSALKRGLTFHQKKCRCCHFNSNACILPFYFFGIILAAASLVVSCVLLGRYHLHTLTLIHAYFLIAPVLMISGSALSLLVAGLSILTYLKKKVSCYLSVAIIKIASIIFQTTAVVFSVIFLRNMIPYVDEVEVNDHLKAYVEDNATRIMWDSVQNRFQCCGGLGKDGFNDWEPFLERAFPDSCCTVKYPNCGREAYRTLASDFSKTVYERIHAQGCFSAISETLEGPVSSLLIAWQLAQGVLVSIQLLALLFFIRLIIFSRGSEDLSIFVETSQQHASPQGGVFL